MKCWIECSEFNSCIYLCKKNIFWMVKREDITEQVHKCTVESIRWWLCNDKFAAIGFVDSKDIIIVANGRVWNWLIKQYNKLYKKKTLNNNKTRCLM